MSSADPSHCGLIQVAALASYVVNRVPDLAFGKFGMRQTPEMNLVGQDFAVAKPVSVLTSSDKDFVPIQPTHVLLKTTAILDDKGAAKGDTPLLSGTTLRVLSEKDDFVEVARAGRRLGFLHKDDLAPLQ
ncbi:hypothetical protein MOV76_06975 [Rhizobium sp. PRIMUS64]|uniref:hypothetical protein n=1 Tax=Rhizobium sp. PRIMUS64 TaxID=2908925 RepID=UPI001FF289AA|nr:hypothetical protein [Rhizobium sp. PRIMUS64]MCJ9691375.1 hypothetical protein [Rhizobium sp. PRIMUS64]